MLRSIVAYRSLTRPLRVSAVAMSTTTSVQGLTPEQIATYHRDGYLHIPNALSLSTCDQLRTHIHDKYISQCNLTEHRSIFTTNEQARKMNDRYFLESGDQIRYFFEEHAFSPSSPSTLQVPIDKAINKIGHNLHNLDPVFHSVSYAPSVQAILQSLDYQRPIAVQSMYIFKQPSIGGEVCPHQDGTYLYTEPQSVLGLWWALEDCTEQNGCLYGVPGSHLQGVRQHFRRTTEQSQDKLLELVPPTVEPFNIDKSVPILTKKGDLVLLHNAFVHHSKANTSPHSRHAYSIHVVESAKNVQYPRENWLQNSDYKPFSPMYDHTTV